MTNRLKPQTPKPKATYPISNTLFTNLPTAYDPHATEQRLYEWWEAQGYFRPETLRDKGLISPDAQPWCITMPPPNVTGALHLGHAMIAAIEDLMTRYYRMKGRLALWLPGSDHAGIATQNVVERKLAQEGLTRHDLGRERFIERCWEWKEVYHRRITDQHRHLGISCDWTRERFTLDNGLSRAVRTAFVRLYKRGLIYRGAYLVNWCPRCESAISDLEVIGEERDSHLWYVRYPLVSAPPSPPWRGGEWGSGRWAEGATEFIEMATTRPETILGDTAVAVSPDDARYQDWVGRIAVLPAVERRIPIIADKLVDPEFGTGAVKVTPAHDPNDYEMGLRHNLDKPDVMTDDGHMSELAGPYAGLDRFACREAIVADLEREGLLLKIEPYHHAVGTCERCHTDIEPRISTQWFVNVKPLAEQALAATRTGRIRIIPAREERRWNHWMTNIRDWCISRQLWWGHRIPVWYCDDCGAQTCEIKDPTACAHCGSAHIHQDPDVLDTWFSSGLWPFSTLGWPDDTPDLRTFYPTDVRETGYDILFFWVAREVMLGLAMMGDVPYRTVYLNGLIRDQRGRKISKSLPDAEKYDPLYIIDEYGTDALRYTLTTSSTPGNDMNLDPRRIEGARNFANKVWNAARFIVGNLKNDEPLPAPCSSALTLADRWILSRHHRLVSEVNRLMDEYQYGEAGRQINDFLWNEFCDWYIEISKLRLYAEDDEEAANTARYVLVHVLERTLRLLHPFMPFVTEEIWQHLPHEGEAIMVAPWPEPEGERDEAADAVAESDMALVMDLVRAIRNARAEHEVKAGHRIAATIAGGDHAEMLRQQAPIIAALAHVDPAQLRIEAALEQKPPKAVALVVGAVECYLPLAGLVDIDAERARLTKELDGLAAQIARLEKLLANEGFCSKAPTHVVDKERARLVDLQERRARIQARLVSLQ